MRDGGVLAAFLGVVRPVEVLDGEVGHPGVGCVASAVAVGVDADLPRDAGPPFKQGHNAEVGDLSTGDGHVERVEDVVLHLVPDRDRIRAVRDTLDVEGSVDGGV